MNMTVSFPDIDTSYWKTKDPEWMAERKAGWSRIEKMLPALGKRGKGKTALKQYYLKGKLPDWDAMAWWDDEEGHVDLFCFLWLHPSWDEALLTVLRNAYIGSDCIVPRDLSSGFGNLLWAGVRSCEDHSDDPEEEVNGIVSTDGHNELLFRVIMGDLQQTRVEFKRVHYLGHRFQPYQIPMAHFDSIYRMGEWLCVKKMLPFNNDFLYQYDLPLEWWYRSAPTDEDYFVKIAQSKAVRDATEEALWRIHHFDDVAEGPGPRTTMVKKMRVMLDERPFIGEFKAMWQRVKAGGIQLENPWSWQDAKVIHSR